MNHIIFAKPDLRRNSRGFTILELMVATLIFAVILLVITAGVIRFTTQYFKGVTSTKTQAAARTIIDDISRQIQYGKNVNPNLTAGGVKGLCIDNVLYSYQIGAQVDNGKHAITKYSGTSCNSATPNMNLGNELLGSHMRLAALDVTQVDAQTYTVHVHVLYGDNDLLVPASAAWNDKHCASVTGSQFCASSDLTTTVQQRVDK